MSGAPVPVQRLANKVAIVTGSSSGLGRAIAIAFAANGARLVVCADLIPTARGDFGAEEAATSTHDLICKRYGDGKAKFVKTDVTVGKEVEALVQEAVRSGGRLDVIANNAGVGGRETAGAIHEMEEDTWDSTMRVNCRSVFLGCKFACAQFLKQDPHPSGHRGWIINTASILGLVGLKPGAATGILPGFLPPLAAYCASKSAVVLLTKQIAVEYGKAKIHCNCICPGHTRTPMTQPVWDNDTLRQEVNTMTPWAEWGVAEDVARTVVFLASEDAAYVTGVALPVDGGNTAQ